jgi:tetratricopeptide (TPR) repeat protein
MKKLLLLTFPLGVLVGLYTLAAYAQSGEDWNARGKEAYSKNQYEEAVKHYSKALEIDPAFQKVHFNRGLAYYRMGKWQDARSDLGAAISANPKDHEAIFYRGLSYFGEGKYGEAAAQFDKAAEIENLPVYMFNGAVARFNSCLYYATIQQCKMALRSKPDEQTKAMLDDLIVKSEERLKQDLERKVAAKRAVVQMEPEKKKPVKLVYKTFEGARPVGGPSESYNAGSGGGGG